MSHKNLLCDFVGCMMLCLSSCDQVTGKFTKMKIPAEAEICPAEIVEIKGEPLKISEKPPSAWSSETVLSHVCCLKPGHGTPVPGALVPGSVQVRHGKKLLELGKDYICDNEWGALSLAPQSSITSNDEVSVDYKYSLRRIDSLVINTQGKKTIVKGNSDLTTPTPCLPDNQKRLVNIFLDYHCNRSNALILPLRESSVDAQTSTTPGRIPKTLAKIKSGQPVKIVCWGDSVTAGSEVDATKRYATVLDKKLKEKFPLAKIDVEVIAVGGSCSCQWLYPKKHPKPGCDFAKVIAANPNLVTIEFVNDSYLTDKESFHAQYNDILSRLQKINAEVIFITPHFVRNMDRKKDTRQYTALLKSFAQENKLALADASARWEHLWLEGLPYESLLINNINHPDYRGHIIFAEELMKCFE